jgi:hypothetical protein
MTPLPVDEIKLHVADDMTVLVGAHLHNGSIWWTRLPNPRQNFVGSGDLKGVGVELVHGRAAF